VRRTEQIRSFSAVLNATTNFILDRLAEGQDVQYAIKSAQEAGYAEANPHFDLNGTDAAQKLILLAREAFGVSLPFDEIERVGIENATPQWRAARDRGQVVRLVAECARTKEGIRASLKPQLLPVDHPLAEVRGADNRLIVELEDGEPIVVSGKGAGRWPTTEA